MARALLEGGMGMVKFKHRKVSENFRGESFISTYTEVNNISCYAHLNNGKYEHGKNFGKLVNKEEYKQSLLKFIIKNI